VSRPSVDVVVIGAGIVGASCARALALAGHSVTVVERGAIAGGTTSAGEGNILVSDKPPGPELSLARLSLRLWLGLRDDLGADALEHDAKGGLVVARSQDTAASLRALAEVQRDAGVEVRDLGPGDLMELEPNLARDAVSGALYPDDGQVQPMLATATILRDAVRHGATVHAGTAVTGFLRDARGAVAGITTASPEMPAIVAPWVVNAAGAWAGDVAGLAGLTLPILPRRGFILVTEPLPRVIRHKVYTADYVANVASGDAGLETSVVVEGTRAGSVLIGASRERVGFDRSMSLPVLRRLAAQAIGLFPFLADVSVMRAYLGFRPYCPDHLPVIGPDPRLPGLVQACGHEGAGIGLAPATGHLVAQVIAGERPDLDLAPFRPDRFAEAVA
jgi:D-hydroxyproline dehydrogenase subunit beta